MFIVQISQCFQQTVQLHPWCWNMVLLWSHILRVEFNAFSAATAISCVLEYISRFSDVLMYTCDAAEVLDPM